MKGHIFKQIVFLFILISYVPVVQSQTWITEDDMEYSPQDYQYDTQELWYVDLGSNKFVQITYTLDGRPSGDSFYVYNVDDNWNIVSTAFWDFDYSNGVITTVIPNGKALIVYDMGDDSYGSFDNYSGLLFYILGYNSGGMSYVYDASGNRVSRTIIFATTNNSLRSAMRKEVPEEEVVYEEQIDYSDGIEKKEATILIYPNPTQGVFAVEIRNVPEEEISGEIYLLKANGQLIDKKGIVKDSKVEFDLSREASGVYLVNIHLGENISSWKIIKK
ncbi:T9SS type A sorting domain-containing protein [Viscerimonas tarda]